MNILIVMETKISFIANKNIMNVKNSFKNDMQMILKQYTHAQNTIRNTCRNILLKSKLPFHQ